MATNWKRYDGTEAAEISKAEVRSWIKRCREDLRDIEAAIREGDLDAMKEYADDLGGAGCELSNIAAATAGLEVW